MLGVLFRREQLFLLTCALLTALATGCQGGVASEECTDPQLVGALEFGQRGETGEFVPLTDGQALLVDSIQAFYGITTSLRAEELDPRLPEPEVAIYVSGVLIGGNRSGETSDMVPDGEAHVLENLVVLFQHYPCCFNCLEARVTGSLVDRNCHKCEGSVRVVLQASGSCPPVGSHCDCDPATCSAPFTPQECAE